MKHKHYKKMKKRGDKLEVKLRDSNYHPIYENEVDTSDTKQLHQVVEDLEDKGVPLKKAIRKKNLDDKEFW